MAKKVFNMEGGLHSANAFTAFEARAYGSCVANATSLKVVPAGGMNVRVSVGDGIIDGQTPRRIQIDAPETVAVSPASTSYARKDLIVAYIDSGVSATTSVVDNTNDILKIVAVNGTPSAVPATPSDSEIKAKIGAGNQYMILAEINVSRSASSIIESMIVDQRSIFGVFYEVGDIFETTSSKYSTVSAVESRFGGKWETFGAGRVLVGVGSNGENTYNAPNETGGSESVSLTPSNLPKITYKVTTHGYSEGSTIHSVSEIKGLTVHQDISHGRFHTNSSTGGADSVRSYKIDIGKDQPDKIPTSQPYITVYRYRKIA